MNYAPGTANRSKVIYQEVTSSVADNDVANCFEMDSDFTDEKINNPEAESDNDNGEETISCEDASDSDAD